MEKCEWFDIFRIFVIPNDYFYFLFIDLLRKLNRMQFIRKHLMREWFPLNVASSPLQSLIYYWGGGDNLAKGFRIFKHVTFFYGQKLGGFITICVVGRQMYSSLHFEFFFVDTASTNSTRDWNINRCNKLIYIYINVYDKKKLWFGGRNKAVTSTLP